MTVAAPPQTVVCPDCGRDVPYLVHATGFCQICTNEYARGGPVTPHDHRRFP